MLLKDNSLWSCSSNPLGGVREADRPGHGAAFQASFRRAEAQQSHVPYPSATGQVVPMSRAHPE